MDLEEWAHLYHLEKTCTPCTLPVVWELNSSTFIIANQNKKINKKIQMTSSYLKLTQILQQEKLDKNRKRK